MTVAQLMQIPEFQHFRLIAGNVDNDREITSVNVIDSPDSYTYFKGGEFLLTNTYIMREDISILRDITVACAEIGVCAIGIKLARFIQDLPREYIDLANELNFPVILIPVEFAFEAIISRVYAEIVNNQLARLMYSERVHTSFTQLVLEGGPIDRILSTLSELIRKPTCYYDTFFERFYSSRSAQRVPLSHAPLPLAKALAQYPAFLLNVCETKYGYLVVENDGEQSVSGPITAAYSEISIQHASTVIKLTAQREISNWQIESKHRDEFVQGLLLNSYGTQAEIDARKSLYGWKFDGGIVAVVIDTDEGTWSLAGQDMDFIIRRKIRKVYPSSMYTTLGTQLVFLVEPLQTSLPFPRHLERAFCQLVQDIRGEYSLTMHVGVGTYRESLMDTHISYQEAQIAQQIGRRLQQQVTCYENLGLYQLLAKVSDSRCIEEFLDKYAGKLAAYDRKHNSEYFKTLQYLAANDWNLQKTSDRLYVHYNTLKNRYYKISQILGMDLHNPDVKMCLMVSLKLYHLGKRGE